MFSSLRSANLRRFFLGQALSQSGTWMQKLAISILVLRLTDSGVAVGLAAFAQFGPLLALGPWAGVLCDRLDRHRLLFAINGAGALVAATFAAMGLTGITPLWMVYTATLAAGLVQAFENPTRRNFLSDLVEPAFIQNAVSLNAAIMTVCEVVALAMGGLLIGGPGIGWCFVVDAATYVPQLILFARMDRTALRPRVLTPRATGRLVQGLRYVWRTRAIRFPLILLAAVGMFGYGTYPVLVPLLASRDLAGGSATYTVLFLSISTGEMVGALAIARRTSSGLGPLARRSVVFGIANSALGFAPNVAVAAPLAMCVGFTLIRIVVGINGWVQLEAAADMRGRVLSLVSVATVGLGAIGGLLVGIVAQLAAAPAAFALGGLVCAVVGSVIGIIVRGVRT